MSHHQLVTRYWILAVSTNYGCECNGDLSPTTVYSERRPFPDGRIISDYLSELCSAVMVNGTSNVPIFMLLRSTTPRRSV